MKASVLLIHSSRELVQIHRLDPALVEKSEVCFLTADVSSADLRDLPVKTFFYLDSHLSPQDLKVIDQQASEILETWYLDSTGKDLTQIDGISLGRCYCAYLYHILCLALKSQRLVRRLISEFETIYLTATPDPFLDAVIQSEVVNRLQLKKLDLRDTESSFVPTPTIVFKSAGMKVYFEFSKNLKFLLRNIYVFLGQLLFGFFKTRKRVVMVSAGKIDDWVNSRVRIKAVPESLQFIFPLTRSSISFKADMFIFMNPLQFFYKRKIAKLLLEFDRGKVAPKYLSQAILDFVIKSYLVPSFAGLLAYYHSCKAQLDRIKPDLVVLSAESHETNLSLAQAARHLGVATAIMPHGLTYPLLPKSFYSGKNKIYDSAFVFSEFHRAKYQAKGFAMENIFVSSFPYFQKFFKKNGILTSDLKYQSVLILPVDYSDISKVDFVTRSLTEVIDCCQALGFRSLAIKARIEAQLKAMFIKGQEIYHNETKIPVYFGYTDFPKLAVNYDLIVGPISSATIEALLMGKDYYTYHPEEALLGSFENSPYLDIIYVAKSSDELAENIKKRRIFKPGRSIDDFIYMTKLQTREQAFDFFEAAISRCLSQENV